MVTLAPLPEPLTSDFAADLLQMQQGEIFDARFACRFRKGCRTAAPAGKVSNPAGRGYAKGTIMFGVTR
jgi:hypothetical protein